MRKFFVNVLDKVGLYEPFVNIKRRYDKNRYKKQESLSHTKRLEFYRQFVNIGDLVFDVGANIGNRVRVFLDLGCKVVAVEPQQECIKELQKKFDNRIELIPKGLGEKEEQKTLHISDVNTISSLSEEWIESVKQSRFSQHEWNKKVTIELTTLDKLIHDFGLPRFCKIDVEGYELEVLRGLSQPIPAISLEYTVPEQTSRLLACLELCNKLHGLYKYNYSPGEDMELALDNFISYAEFIALVKTKQFEETNFGDIYLKL